MNSQHLKNSRIAFCAYCVNVERDTFYPPHNNIAEVETGDQANSFTPASLLHCSVFPTIHSSAAANPRFYTSYFQCKLLHIQKPGSKPLLSVSSLFSDAAEPVHYGKPSGTRRTLIL